MRYVDDESANTIAFEVMTRWQFETEKPHYDALGLDPDNKKEKLIMDAIGYAIRAGEQYGRETTNSVPFIRLSTLIAFGVVNSGELIRLHDKLNRAAKTASGD